MWLLENEEALEGRQLWLKPGKTYLFGRTAAEPGQLAISHNTISRKHLTITVEPVAEGHAYHLTSRSKLTIEDLATKIGTVVNGQKIKGEKYVVDAQEVDMTMGKCPSNFRITWIPVVFTFSFTKKELQTQPLESLQEQFESLDIKLLNDYNVDFTTHVVSKKRNTAKGLQALINGRYVVAESFIDAVMQAVEPPSDGDTADTCMLERDFTKYWPDALQHLPPRGGEPVQHPDSIYTPDLGRKDVFDGYTFIFYDTTQYKNLLAPITNACGKAMIHTINPGEEQVDDFVRYVKEVAGEKGLGCFDDGSEGKGVVMVRYLPAKGNLISWYTDFITAVSLRLDHRPIEQNEFLEAILVKDASMLRRPLEVESSAPSQGARPTRQPAAGPNPEVNSNSEMEQVDSQPVNEEQQSESRRGRARGPVKRRFAGFDDDVDMDMGDSPPAKPVRPHDAADEEAGLFVSQEPDAPQSQPAASGSPRKRRASPLPEDNLMDGMAPAAARFKRQRLERGETFASPTPEPAPASTKPQIKKKAKEIDVLAMAARHREEEEARARAEKEDLANLPDDVDLAEIRRLNIVEEMPVREPNGAASRTREQEIADDRWDPRWNGVKNFKKFRRRGEVQGRPPARIIVPLTQVKNKEFGVGDNYWLEDEGSQRSKQASASHPSLQETANPTPPLPPPRKRNTGFVVEESSEEEDVEGNSTLPPVESIPVGSASTRISATQSQKNTRSQASGRTTQSQGKRSVQESASDQRTKRPRPTPRRTEIPASDDSDDELKFRFGRRR